MIIPFAETESPPCDIGHPASATSDVPLVVCPDCRGAVTGRVGDDLRCSECGRVFDSGGGFIVANPAPYYWGEIPQDHMQRVLKEAETTSWQSAVSAMIKEIGWTNGPNNIHGLMRADWWPEVPCGPGLCALDIASGWGQIAFLLSQRFAHVYSMEGVTERARFQSIRRRQDGVENLTIVNADVTSLPLREASFDLIVMNGIVEWLGLSDLTQGVRDVQLGVLKRVRKLLRPGGCLYVGIENRFSYTQMQGAKDHSGLRYTSLMPRWMANRAVRRRLPDNERTERGAASYRTYTYTPRGYRRLLDEAGFDDVRVKWVLPGYNEPLQSADLAQRDLLEHFVRSWRIRRWPRAKRLVGSLLCRSGAHALFMPHVSIFSHATGTRTGTLLDRVCEEMARRAVHLDAGRCMRCSPQGRADVDTARIHYKCFAPGGSTPTAMLKIPRTPAGVSTLEREAEVFQRAAHRVPGLLASRDPCYLRLGDAMVLCERYFPGSQFRNHLMDREAHDRVLDWVLTLRATDTAPTESLCMAQRCRSVAREAQAAGSWANDVRDYTQRLLDQLPEDGSLPVPAVVSHGDFNAANVLIGQGQLFVTDWEWISDTAAPTFDWWHFLMSNAMRIDSEGHVADEQDPRYLLAALRGRSPYGPILAASLRRFMRATGLAVPVIVSGFLEVVLTRIVRDAAHFGSVSRSLYYAFLALALEERIDLAHLLETLAGDESPVETP